MKSRLQRIEDLKEEVTNKTSPSLNTNKRSVEEAFEEALDRMVDSIKPQKFTPYFKTQEPEEDEWL